MKLPVLKHWRLAKSAINWELLLIVLLLVASRGYGQEQRSPHDSLIIDIILQDTVWSEMQLKSIGYKVAVGRYTKADSIKIRENKRNTKSSLRAIKTDSFAKLELLRDIEKDGRVSNYLSKETIIKALPQLDGPAKEFEDNFSIAFLTLEMEPSNQIYHSFSSLIKIGENRFMVYHYKNEGMFSGLLEFIVYSTDSKGYTIEKNIVIKND